MQYKLFDTPEYTLSGVNYSFRSGILIVAGQDLLAFQHDRSCVRDAVRPGDIDSREYVAEAAAAD